MAADAFVAAANEGVSAEVLQVAAASVAADTALAVVAEAAAAGNTTVAAAALDAASGAAAVVSGSKGEDERQAPPEDLVLRARLAAYSEERRVEAAQREFGNAVKILRTLLEDKENTKLHVMRREMLARAVWEDLLFVFTAAGFEEQEAALAWQRSVPELQVALHEVQRAADQCIDSDSVSFVEVSQLVNEGRTLPGIAKVDDKGLGSVQTRMPWVDSTATVFAEPAVLGQLPPTARTPQQSAPLRTQVCDNVAFGSDNVAPDGTCDAGGARHKFLHEARLIDGFST